MGLQPHVTLKDAGGNGQPEDPEFPQRLIDFAIGGWGDKGRVWLDALPDILRQCRDKWGLTLGPATEEIKGNYVGYAELPNGEEAVVKVGVPHRDFSTEMEALAIYDGRGINRLIDKDEDLNAMLLGICSKKVKGQG